MEPVLLVVYFDIKVVWSPRNLPANLSVLGPLLGWAESILPAHILWADCGNTVFLKDLTVSILEDAKHLCFLQSESFLFAGCFTSTINEDLSFLCYLCRWLHTPPFEPEGLGYNSRYDKKEYLFILAVAAARIYFKHICSEWSHYMALSNWHEKFPE